MRVAWGSNEVIHAESKAQQRTHNKLLSWWLNEKVTFTLLTPWGNSQICFMLPVYFLLIKCHSIALFGIGKHWVYMCPA